MKGMKGKGMKKAVAFFMALSMICSLSLTAFAEPELPPGGEGGGPGGPGGGQEAPVEAPLGTLDTWLDASGNEVAADTADSTKYSTNLLSEGAVGSWSNVIKFKYRSAISLKNDAVDTKNSVYALAGKTLKDDSIEGLKMTTATSGYSAVIAQDSDYTITNADIRMNTDSDGTDVNDFAGYGAGVAVYGDSKVTIEDSTIETTGVAKVATFADSGADLIVKNSTLRANGGTIYSEYKSTANQAYMINPPWVLGISGSARTTNVMGDNTTGTYVDSTISSHDWGAVSIDSGSDMKLTLVNCDVKVDGSGYGAYAIGDTTEEYFLGTNFDVETYAVILTGAYVTLDSYTGGDTVSVTKVNGGAKVTDVVSEKVPEGATVNTTVKSDNFGFMFHANGDDNVNNLTIGKGTEITTGNATFLVKKVNNNISVDGADITAEDGVILQMIDNDDDMVGAFKDDHFGMPTFNYSFNEQDGWSSTWGVEVKDSGWVTNAEFTNVDLDGDMYNGTGYTSNGAMTLNVTLGENTTLDGAISATEYQHESKSFTYYDKTKGYDADMAADAADKLGHVINQEYYNGENDVNVTLTDNAEWNVTDTSLITSLEVGENATLNGAVFNYSVDKDGNITLGTPVNVESGKTYEGKLAVLDDDQLITYIDAKGNEVSSSAAQYAYVTNYLTAVDAAMGSWSGLTGLAYRAGLYINGGEIDSANSVFELAGLQTGKYTAAAAKGLKITSATSGFSAVIVKDSDYTISDSTIIMNTDSDGTDVNDFAGYGAAVAAYGDSVVTIDNTKIETTGVAKAATFADNGADLIVTNSDLRANGGDIYKEYKSTANQALMINPPWVLGISGSARTTNVMGDYTTGTYVDTSISSADWGAVSIDTGSNMKLTTINADVTVDGSGYGAYAIGDGTEEYFYGTDFDVQTYAVILTGASVDFESYVGGTEVDITKLDEANTKVATVSSKEIAEGETVNSTIVSDNFGFMFHANGNDNVNNLTLGEGTEVTTGNATFLVKKVNNNITVDGADITSEDGVLLQMIDNDDDMVGAFMDDVFGMPTFNYSFNEPEGWSSTWDVETKDSGWVTNADFTNVDLDGDIYNGSGYTSNGAMTLNVTLGEDTTLKGAIASTEIQHETKSFTYYDETKGYDAETAAAAADKLGHVINQVYYNGENDINVTLEDDAIWYADDTSLVTKLTIGKDASVVYTAAYDKDGNEIELTAGNTYENVTIEGTASDNNDDPSITDNNNTAKPADADKTASNNSKVKSVKTGDSTPLYATFIVVIAAAGAAGVVYYRKRKAL